MYVATVPNRNSPPAILLRESYREGKKIRTRTVANITHWPPERIEALRRCLKGEFDGLAEDVDPVADRIFGVLFALKALAERLGLSKALGRHRKGMLSLFLVLARVADQGSRLSALGWAADQAVAEALGLQNFNEDDLYSALDYLAQYQERIELRLYREYVKSKGVPPLLVLYDVTSSYLEGEHEKKRLILRRNEAVLDKETKRRQDKLQRLQDLIKKRNDFVASSLRANPEAGLRQMTNWTKRYKIFAFTKLSLQEREICLTIDEDKLTQAGLLDGCYVLETDVAAEKMDAVTVDKRYRDLQKVERDFRTMKTGLLEVRPVFVRKKERTCGHVFVAMLALKIVREMEICFHAAFGCTDSGALNMNVQKALGTLSRLSFQRREIKGVEFLTLPQMDERIAAIFAALHISPPQIRKIKL